MNKTKLLHVQFHDIRISDNHIVKQARQKLSAVRIQQHIQSKFHKVF